MLRRRYGKRKHFPAGAFTNRIYLPRQGVRRIKETPPRDYISRSLLDLRREDVDGLTRHAEPIENRGVEVSFTADTVLEAFP
jgi:hypothetical protein